MNAKILFQKALLLLDQNRAGEGEVVLREAIANSRLEHDAYALGGSLACLGDLLFQLGRCDEAKQILTEFSEERFPEDDVLNLERKRVEQLLEHLRT